VPQRKSFELFEKSKRFEEKVAKEEVVAILKALMRQVDKLNNEDLVLMRDYLKKIVQY
jgi:hypothetical protein